MIEPPSRPKSALDSLIVSYSKEKDFKKYREQLAADLFEMYNRTVFDNQVGEMRGRVISILKMNCYNLKILTEAFLPGMLAKMFFFLQLPSDFQITWNKKMRSTAGFCYYSRCASWASKES